MKQPPIDPEHALGSMAKMARRMWQAEWTFASNSEALENIDATLALLGTMRRRVSDRTLTDLGVTVGDIERRRQAARKRAAIELEHMPWIANVIVNGVDGLSFSATHKTDDFAVRVTSPTLDGLLQGIYTVVTEFVLPDSAQSTPVATES